MSKINILEVSPRDGLQNERVFFSVKEKVELIQKLAQAGLNKIEIGAFVSPEALPQMKNTFEVAKQVFLLQEQGDIPKQQEFSVLVPNEYGLDQALECGFKEIAIFSAATDSFCKKNINSTVEASLKTYEKVTKKALSAGLKVRAYLSVAFNCPDEGSVSPSRVYELSSRLLSMGAYQVAVSDTLGLSFPSQVKQLLNTLLKTIPKENLALHFHNVHGMALANVLQAYQLGITSFDGSLGGLGGCPYSKIISGNLATEELLYLFYGKDHPIIKNLLEVSKWLETKIQRTLPSHLASSPYYLKED